MSDIKIGNRVSQNRREFLKHISGGFMQIGAVALGRTKAQARRTTSGNPVLTQASLNVFLKRNQNRLTSYYEEARTDLRAFLERYFTLTRNQKDYFDKSYRRNKRKLDNFLTDIGPGVKSSQRLKNPPRIKIYPPLPKQTSPGETHKCYGDRESGGCCTITDSGTIIFVWGNANPAEITCD